MERYIIEINEENKKYIQIYNHVKKIIEDDIVKKHEKLPPIRKLSQSLGVNTSTIVKAYDLLEKEGYIYKMTGSGSYVSEKKVFDEEVKAKDDDCINFHIGNPSSDIFPLKDFKAAINMALEREGADIFDYDEGLGFLPLRQCIVKYLNKDFKIKASVNNIQIISGAQQGIDIICKTLLNYGDVVFSEEPTYNGAINAFKEKGAKLIQVPMLKDGIDIGILKMKLEKIRPKLVYVMSSFQNPTGISYSRKKKLQLLELASKYDFYILEDDFMSDFKFDLDEKSTLRSLDKNSRVIYIKSFSKILMPGLRIGFLDIPKTILKKVVMAKYSSDISTSSIVQRAMYYYMEYFPWEKNLEKVEEIYKIRFDKTKNIIENRLNEKLNVIMPKGGINFFLGLPRGYSSNDYRNFLLEKGVCIMPGFLFYENPLEDRFFRINIANTNLEEIEKGLEIMASTIDEFLYKYKNRVDFKENKLFF